MKLSFPFPLQTGAAFLLIYASGKKTRRMSFVSPEELGRRKLVFVFFFKCYCCIVALQYCTSLCYSISKMNQLYVYIHLSFFWISFSFKSLQSIEQSSPCFTVGSHQLSVLYIVSVVLEEGMATHPNMLGWRIPWTEEPGEEQSIGSQ